MELLNTVSLHHLASFCHFTESTMYLVRLQSKMRRNQTQDNCLEKKNLKIVGFWQEF